MTFLSNWGVTRMNQQKILRGQKHAIFIFRD